MHALAAGVAPTSWRGLLALATSGGLLPSPSALLVLLSAVALGRMALGLAVVGAFSVGLAVTLTVLGLSLVHGGAVLQRRVAGGRVAALLPRLGALALVALGTGLTVRAALQLL